MAIRLSYTQKSCVSKAAKLISHTDMLQEGAKVGIAVSGGVDSGVLLKIMTILKKKLPFQIDLMALHVNPGFDNTSHLLLLNWLKQLGVSAYAVITDIGIQAHSEENRSRSPCFFCAWRRRKILFEMVKKFRLTHLALGHTGDDVVSTFFVNLFYGGRVETLYPKEVFFKGEFLMIRPLLLIEKAKIKKAAKEWNIPIIENPCPSATKTKRTEIMQFLEGIFRENKKARKNLYSALYNFVLKHVVPDYSSR